MYYPFAAHNSYRIYRLIAVLFLFVVVCTNYPRSVFGEDDKEYATHFRRQGQQAQERGEYGRALFYYSRAAAFLPDDPSIQNDMGLMFEQLGKLDDAETSYRTAITRDTRYLPAYSNLGILLKKTGRYELAVMYLKRRIELGKATDPWTLNAQEELEALYDQIPRLKNERTLESSSQLEQQIAQDRSRARKLEQRRKKMGYELAMRKGLDAFQIRDYQRAVSAFEEALLWAPNSGEARHALKRAEGQARRAQIDASLRVSAWQNRDKFVDRYLDEAQQEVEDLQEEAP